MLDFNTLTKEETLVSRNLLSVRPKKFTPEIRKYLSKHKVYISLTTSPTRLKYVPAVLNLLDLSDVHEIHLNLPQAYRNKTESQYSPTHWYRDMLIFFYNPGDVEYVKMVDSRIKVFWENRDIGPLTKIIPTLRRIKDPGAIIISIDDDIGYPFNLVSSLIYYSVTQPDKIFTGAGFKFGDYPGSDFDRKLWPTKKTSSKYVDIVEGWGGIAYKKKLMTTKVLFEILSLNNVSTTCKLSDDFTISYVLAANGIKCVEVPGIREYLEPFNYGEGEDALHKGSGVGGTGAEDENMNKYHVCLADIDRADTRKSRVSFRRSRTRTR